ncbi:putative holin-like toxin [Bacillus sp. CECT 9360]|uniref:putative holin-like toxin n=1 Tax=unclassified Bacillus (in: firmicutes) TaxID=185979 RepID=UPI0033A4CD8E
MYDRTIPRRSPKGGRLTPRKGGEALTIFETLMAMFTFATLIIAILSFQNKK